MFTTIRHIANDWIVSSSHLQMENCSTNASYLIPPDLWEGEGSFGMYYVDPLAYKERHFFCSGVVPTTERWPIHFSICANQRNSCITRDWVDPEIQSWIDQGE